MNQLGKFALLGALLTSSEACSENLTESHCGIPSSNDTTTDSGNSQDSQSQKIDTKSSKIPETTLLIMKHVAGCYAGLRDSETWCGDNINNRGPTEPKFCDTFFDNAPKYLQDICQKKAMDCISIEYGKRFYACLDTIPADPKCKAALHPQSQASDADGDGLSDHFELWHSNTNPCEPCSFGDTEPCDAESDNDHDGVNNKDSQQFYGGCMSYIPTDECG